MIKNTVVLEDSFILTQPDGAARFDLTDPGAYSRIDMSRGPQSPLFGNHATGGAIAFRTGTGREIDGYEIGVDAGRFGGLIRCKPRGISVSTSERTGARWTACASA